MVRLNKDYQNSYLDSILIIHPQMHQLLYQNEYDHNLHYNNKLIDL